MAEPRPVRPPDPGSRPGGIPPAPVHLRDAAIARAADSFAALCDAATEALRAVVAEQQREDAGAVVARLQRDVASGQAPFPPEACPVCGGPGEVTAHPRQGGPAWLCAEGHDRVWVLSPEAASRARR